MPSGQNLPYTPSVVFARARQIRAKQAYDAQFKQQRSLAQDAQRRQRQLAQDALKPGKTTKPVHPNCGIEVAYRCVLKKIIVKMNDSVLYWMSASFKANEPEVTELAQDALPATELRRSVRKLARRWQRKFNDAAPELATWFLQSVETRSSRALQNILKRGGWTVDFKMTTAQRDVMRAAINENVSLIKSIPSQYFTQIEGMVMRSVTTGRDLQQLTKDLKKQFKVTEHRATLIARDQNNKATAVLTRTRHLELGLTTAIWVHSGGGNHPRPSHVKAGRDKVEYNVRTGWYDPHEKKFIMPGELINCKCVSRAIIPGFS